MFWVFFLELKIKSQSLNFGGPSVLFTLFDTPTPSRGMPIQFVSSFPFKFSSCNTANAYVLNGIDDSDTVNESRSIFIFLIVYDLLCSVGNPSEELKRRIVGLK